MNGGSITGNTAANGGGVYVHDTFTVSGAVKISGNKKSDGSNRNVYLSSGKTITVTDALDGAEIGVTTAKTPAASSPITCLLYTSFGGERFRGGAHFALDKGRRHIV